MPRYRHDFFTNGSFHHACWPSSRPRDCPFAYQMLAHEITALLLHAARRRLIFGTLCTCDRIKNHKVHFRNASVVVNAICYQAAQTANCCSEPQRGWLTIAQFLKPENLNDSYPFFFSIFFLQKFLVACVTILWSSLLFRPLVTLKE